MEWIISPHLIVTLDVFRRYLVERLLSRTSEFSLEQERILIASPSTEFDMRTTYRQSIFGVYVPEPLYVVEHEPGQRDYHQDDESDGDEKYRRSGTKYIG